MKTWRDWFEVSLLTAMGTGFVMFFVVNLHGCTQVEKALSLRRAIDEAEATGLVVKPILFPVADMSMTGYVLIMPNGSQWLVLNGASTTCVPYKAAP